MLKIKDINPVKFLSLLFPNNRNFITSHLEEKMWRENEQKEEQRKDRGKEGKRKKEREKRGKVTYVIKI